MRRQGIILIIMLAVAIPGNIVYGEDGGNLSSRTIILHAGSFSGGWHCGELYEGVSRFHADPGLKLDAGYRLYRGLTLGGSLNYQASFYSRPMGEYYDLPGNQQCSYILSWGPSLRYYLDLGRWIPYAGLSYQYSSKTLQFDYPSLFPSDPDISWMEFTDHRHSMITTAGITFQIFRSLGVFAAYDFELQMVQRGHFSLTGNAPDGCFAYAERAEGKVFTGYLHRITMGISLMI